MIDKLIDQLVSDAKLDGQRMVKQAREQTERDFDHFRRSVGQKFRWIRYNGGKK